MEAKARQDARGEEMKQEDIKGLIRLPTVKRTALEESEADFQKNFKPLLDECEKWRRESSQSHVRVASALKQSKGGEK